VDARALVVLGCRVRSAAALRRVRAASQAFREGKGTVVVASGGRVWGTCVEADAMAEDLQADGVPEKAIVRERCSFSTRENARYTARLLARRGVTDAVVVTCAWHLPRAMRAFHDEGVRAVGLGVIAKHSLVRLAYYGVREKIAMWLDR